MVKSRGFARDEFAQGCAKLLMNQARAGSRAILRFIPKPNKPRTPRPEILRAALNGLTEPQRREQTTRQVGFGADRCTDAVAEDALLWRVAMKYEPPQNPTCSATPVNIIQRNIDQDRSSDAIPMPRMATKKTRVTGARMRTLWRSPSQTPLRTAVRTRSSMMMSARQFL